MNRIDRLFKDKKNNILSIFFTAGFPALNDTLPIIDSLSRHGANLIEIGIPFSDPMADGPVIQDSNKRALDNGMNLKILFDQLNMVRNHTDIPLILMGYLNPIYHFGFEAFCRTAAKCGIDGLIIPDLPFEEYLKSYKDIAENYGLHVIMLITPETSDERIRLIDDNTEGFIYMVSTASTTGAKSSFDERNIDYFRRISEMNLKNPCLIGFGISNKKTFDQACLYASGAIIGSKFISLLKDRPIAGAITELISALKQS